MRLLSCASSASVWRGYNYCQERRVRNLTEIEAGVFTADVVGTADELYAVEIDAVHPRRSTCNCPHADGKPIVCKHMVATYFTAYPEENRRIFFEFAGAERQAEPYEEEFYDQVIAYVGDMEKYDLQQDFLKLIFFCPDAFDRFLRRHHLEKDRMITYVGDMEKYDLQQDFLELIFVSPRSFDEFVIKHDLYDYWTESQRQK